MAANAKIDEVDEVVRELKKNKGFSAYSIMNNDGIVIKHENMEYKRAVHYTAVVLELCAKTRKFVRELFESPDNEVESLRLKTKDYEMVIAQHSNFTLLVIQEPVKETPSEEEGGEEKKAE